MFIGYPCLVDLDLGEVWFLQSENLFLSLLAREKAIEGATPNCCYLLRNSRDLESPRLARDLRENG